MAAASSRAASTLELSLVAAAALVASLAAIWFFAQRGELYRFGDAEAHLNIARRILDNRQPAYREIGTVWLPVPHVLMLPFVSIDRLWRTGFAGTIPAAACFIAAVTMLFAALRRLAPPRAAWCGTLVFLANPNLLYLQSTAMTEPVMFAALSGMLLSTVAYAQRGTQHWLLLAAAFSAMAALTRYEGWFLIPFVAVFFWRAGGFRAGFLFGVLGSLAPLYWLAHNWWLYGDALYFYQGPWSAKAIYARQLAEGMAKYPPDGNWPMTLLYFGTAVELVDGPWVLLIGALGLLVAIAKRWLWPALFLLLGPLFYLWSMYSSGTPIFVPTLWPHSYYNTRYALVALPALALGMTAFAAWMPPPRLVSRIATALVIASIGMVWKGEWTVRREGIANSDSRLEWTEEAARFLHTNYRPGDGILYSFGDQTGILRQAGIPLRETLHDGNEFRWLTTLARPELFLRERWAIAFTGDPVAKAVARASRGGVRYRLVHRVVVAGAKPVDIYRREAIPLR